MDGSRKRESRGGEIFFLNEVKKRNLVCLSLLASFYVYHNKQRERGKRERREKRKERKKVR